MSQYVKIEKRGGEIRFADGSSFIAGQTRPLGVGKITLCRDEDGALAVTRYTGKGNHQYTRRLDRDGAWLVGPYSCQWQKPWQEEVDPILRVLRQFEIPLAHLRRYAIGQSVAIAEFLFDREWDENEFATEFLTDGKKSLAPDSEEPDLFLSGAVTGATYAVEKEIRGGNRKPDKFVGRIFVWPGCDPDKLAAVVGELKFGHPTTF